MNAHAQTGPSLLDEHLPTLEEHHDDIQAWFNEQRAALPLPVYASVDVRDAGWKVGAVDANSFPAGFNNVGADELPQLAEGVATNLRRTHPGARHTHLYPESHTRNPGYVENLRTLCAMLHSQGFTCTIGSPALAELGSLDGLSGPLMLNQVELVDDQLRLADGREPDLVLLNHDLAEGMLPGLETMTVVPDPAMGWHRRRKSQHFAATDPFSADIAHELGLDPWLFCPTWRLSREKCLAEEDCMVELAAEADDLLARIASRYDTHGIESTPTVYVKNERGTYGLGILNVTDGEELLHLSKRRLHRLTYSKGGVDAEDFLLQEGVPTALSLDGAPLEPVVYLSDSEAASWFYRVNPKRDAMGNLNGPNAHFLSRHEMESRPEGPAITARAETWHALVAEIASLGMAKEQAQLHDPDALTSLVA